jgi:DNA-directed RNA polymerase subunit RPC12/RpoP
MPLSEIVASKLLPCPKCGSLVWLARIMPDESECDQGTFECEDCGHQVTRIFELCSSTDQGGGSGRWSYEPPI